MSERFLYIYAVGANEHGPAPELPVIVAEMVFRTAGTVAYDETDAATLARFRTTEDAEVFAYALQLTAALTNDGTVTVHVLPSAEAVR